MSSTHFSIIPLAGDSGTTRITVRPTGNNNTHQDYVSTAVVDNGQTTKSITIKQYGVPTFAPVLGGSPVSFPSTGASVSFDVYSHYRFYFDFPSWITIQDGVGNSYQSGVTIPAARAESGGTWVFTASPNGSSAARNATITMYHYGLDLLNPSSAVTTVAITQPAADSSAHFIVSPQLLKMDFDSAQTRTVSVVTNVADWYASVSPQLWDLDKDSMESITDPIPNELRVTNNTHNQGSIQNGRIDINCVNPSYSGSVEVMQAYQPSFSSYQSSIPASGGSFHMNLSTCYDWWIADRPSWVTAVTDTAGIEHYEQYTMNSPHSGASLVLNGYVSENNTGSQRSATIRLGYRRWDNATASTYQQINISQNPYEDTIFVIPSPSAITFESTATSGTLKSLRVSANTTWNASWDDPSNHYFDLPYATTGANGTTYLSVRYLGTSGESSTNNLRLYNNGPTVVIPVTKLSGNGYINKAVNNTSLEYTGGTVSIDLDWGNLFTWAFQEHGTNTATAVWPTIQFFQDGWAWDYATFYVDGHQVTPEGNDFIKWLEFKNEETGASHSIRVVVNMPASVGEELSYGYGRIDYVMYRTIGGSTDFFNRAFSQSDYVYIFGNSD